MSKIFYHHPKGFSALLIVLIISAACLAMAAAAVWLNLGELETEALTAGGQQAFYLADGCLENALERLKIDPTYNGESLSAAGGSCIITIVKDGLPAGQMFVAASGTIGDWTKKIQAKIIIAGDNITIDSWQEVNQ